VRVAARRLCFAALVAATVIVLAWQTGLMLRVNGWSLLKLGIFVLFVVLLVPVALAFWTALIGFIVRWHGGDALDLARALEPEQTKHLNLPRTAIVMPIYNEDPVRVFAGLKAIFRSLEETGWLWHFDFFVLSDTTDPDLWVREELAFAGVQKEVSDPGRLFYRNRRQNVERKTGNIADFCAAWGERYRYMIVLDADSIMTGTSLINLVRMMERNPRVGIIQAPPLPVNRQTLFARLQQFAMHAYSSIFITGLNFWQGGAANYWGHNAIIRIRPFVEHCRLPRLPGKPPLGGCILSHDFVEAAFMRRAGWKVFLASGLHGSYEEMPASLLSYAARDRRWCQGNLQHARLLSTPKFHLVNRIHLAMGIMAYLASPLWLLLLALTTAEGIIENLGRHLYFSPQKTLFPAWPISVQQQAILLFISMMAMLLAPKFLSLFCLLRHRESRARFGGGCRLALNVLLETLLSTLLAPNFALLRSRFVMGILLGKDTKWEAQDRGEAGTGFAEAVRRHWLATLFGAVWSAVLWVTVPRLFWWFSPLVAGFLLAIPLSAWTSRTRVGQWAEKRGWFVIPDELRPPQLLRDLHEELNNGPRRPWATAFDGLARVLDDPVTFDVHLALVSAPPKPKHALYQHHLEGLKLKVRHGGVETLTSNEKRELLLDPDSLQALKSEPGFESRSAVPVMS
jgi:membrane glycosyltransferase